MGKSGVEAELPFPQGEYSEDGAAGKGQNSGGKGKYHCGGGGAVPPLRKTILNAVTIEKYLTAKTQGAKFPGPKSPAEPEIHWNGGAARFFRASWGMRPDSERLLVIRRLHERLRLIPSNFWLGDCHYFTNISRTQSNE